HLDQQTSRNGRVGSEEPSQRKLFGSDKYETKRTEGLRRIFGRYKINGSPLLYTPAYAQRHSKEFASLKLSVCEGVKYVYILGGDVTQEDIKNCNIFVSRGKVLDSSSSGWPVELTLQMVMDRYFLDLYNGSRTELVNYLSAIYTQLQPIVGGNEAFTDGPGFSMCFLEATPSDSLTYTDDKKSDRTISQSGQTSQTDLYRVDEITQDLSLHSQNNQEFETASSAVSKDESNFCMQIRGTFSISGQKVIYKESYKETTSEDYISLQQSVCDHIKFVYIYGGNISEEYITSCILSVTTENDAAEVKSRDPLAELCLELVFRVPTQKMIPDGQQNVVKHLASVYLELRPEVEDTEAFSKEVQFFECSLWTTIPNHSGRLPKFSSESSTIHFGPQSTANSTNEKDAMSDLYFDSEASVEVEKIVNNTSEKVSGISLTVAGQIRTVSSVEDSELYEAQVSVVGQKFTSSSMPRFETINLFPKTIVDSGSAEEVKFVYSYGGNVPQEYIVTCNLMITTKTDEHAEAKLPEIYAELSLELVFAVGLRNIFRSVQPNTVRYLASIYFELQPTLGDTEAFSDGVRFSECEDWQPSNTESHQPSTEVRVTTTTTATTTAHHKSIPAGTSQTIRNTNLAKQTPEDDEEQHSTDHTQQTDSYPNNKTSSERVASIRNLSDEIVGPTTEVDNSIQTTTSQ
ncbi:hypothetical protein X801_06088, partial [Opisthorchis viverrini]